MSDTTFEVPCATGMQSFTVQTGDGRFMLRDTNGAPLLALTLDPEDGFTLVPSNGIRVLPSCPVNAADAARWCASRGLLYLESGEWKATPSGMTAGLVLSEAYMREHVDAGQQPELGAG